MVGALASIILIWGLTLWLIYEAIDRVINRPDVNGEIMLITAVFGLFCNIIMLLTMKAKKMGHSHGIGPSHGDHTHSHGGGKEHGSHGPKEHGDHAAHGDGKVCGGHDDTNKEKKKGGDGGIGDDFKNINERAAYIHILGDLI